MGDLLNKALVQLYNKYGSFIHLYIQLHDAIYVLVPDEALPLAIANMRECMLMPLKFKNEVFTIDVDFSIGKSWGKMKDIEWQDYVTVDNEILESADVAIA